MKVDNTKFFFVALLVSSFINGVLFFVVEVQARKLSKLQSQPTAQQESWVAPLQRPMKSFDTTPKTNQP